MLFSHMMWGKQQQQKTQKRIFNHSLDTILSEDYNPLYRTTVVTNGVEHILEDKEKRFVEIFCEASALNLLKRVA